MMNDIYYIIGTAFAIPGIFRTGASLSEEHRKNKLPDREKQFLYQLLMQEPDPDAAIANFREMMRLKK